MWRVKNHTIKKQLISKNIYCRTTSVRSTSIRTTILACWGRKGRSWWAFKLNNLYIFRVVGALMGNTSFSLLLLLLEQGKTKPKLENDESVESLLWRRARTVLKKTPTIFILFRRSAGETAMSYWTHPDRKKTIFRTPLTRSQPNEQTHLLSE